MSLLPIDSQPASHDSTPWICALAGSSVPPRPVSESKPNAGPGAGGSPDSTNSHRPFDAPVDHVGGLFPPAPAVSDSAPASTAPGQGVDLAGFVARLGWPLLLDDRLGTAAAVVDDLEGMRKANANRLGALERDLGELATHDPQVRFLSGLVDGVDELEHQAVLNLSRLMRAHPLGPWVKAQRGVGDKQAARLLAAIRDPFVNDSGDVMRPRTVSQLWAYCGLHVVPAPHSTDRAHKRNDAQEVSGPVGVSSGSNSGHARAEAHRTGAGVAARRRRGEKANWSTTAKTRVWNIVDSCMKQIDRSTCLFSDGLGYHTAECGCSPYRRVVDERRQHTAVTRPDWSPAHSLADGKRVAMKALLRDLWRESRRLYLEAAAS